MLLVLLTIAALACYARADDDDDMLVHCSPDVIPSVWFNTEHDPRIQEFHSLTEICSDTSDGIGLHCTRHGSLQIHRPVAALHYGADGNSELLRVCHQSCSCQASTSEISSLVTSPSTDTVMTEPASQDEPLDIASFFYEPALHFVTTDELFAPLEAPLPTSAPNSEMSSQTMQDNFATNSHQQGELMGHIPQGIAPEYSVKCSERYGHPEPSHCLAALQQFLELEPNPLSPTQPFQFVLSTEDSLLHRTIYPTIDLPRLFVSGSCTLMIAPSQIAEQSTFLLRQDVSTPVSHIIDHCTQKGNGGSAEFNVFDLQAGRFGRTDPAMVGFVLYGPDSDFDTILRQRNTPLIQDADDVVFRPAEAQIGGLGQKGSKEDTATSTRQCSRRSDCGTASNRVCAQVAEKLPAQGSWSKFTCTSIINAAFAVSFAKTHHGCTRGRCLLSSEGSVHMYNATEPILSIHNHTLNSTIFRPNRASLELGIASQRINGTDNATEVAVVAMNSAIARLNNTRHHQAEKPLSEIIAELGIEKDLICPCNCTFVSSSCCFSDLVYDKPWSKSNLLLPPTTESTCDTATGKWVLSDTTLPEQLDESATTLPVARHPAAQNIAVVSGVAWMPPPNIP